MKSKKILLLGASLESDNRGVNALGIGAITLLRKNFNNSKITLICLGKPELKQIHICVDNEDLEVDIHYFSKEHVINGIKEAYLFRFFKIKPKSKISLLINEQDISYDINEGDSFSDIYGLKRTIRHFADSKLVLSWNIPLTFLPQTIGPFNTSTGKILSKHILNKLEKLYVRDKKAFPFIESIGIEKTLEIDMAVHITSVHSGLIVKPNTVGININGLMYFNNYKSLEGKYDNYKEFLNKLVVKIIELGFEVLIVPHTYNALSPNAEDDLLASKDFINNNPEYKNKVSSLSKDYSAQELKHIISQTSFFFGSRMHSCIAALSNSIPTVGLAYSYKFEGTFKMFKQQENVFNSSGLKQNEIDKVINEILVRIQNKEKIRENLLVANNRKLLRL
jgi:polysaccharide pyruvyl transferase WcaK-like protein